MKRAAPIFLALPLVFAAVASHAQSAVDERAIIAAVSALDAAIDAKDWARARALLLDEITVALPGEEPATLAGDALVDRWREALHAAKQTFRLRGSERVTFDGADSAVLRSRAHVLTQVEGIAGEDLHELWADYHHELDRGENGWRVRHYGYVPRIERGNLGVIQHRLAAPAPQGTSETPTDAGDDQAPAEGDASGNAEAKVSDGTDGATPAGTDDAKGAADGG